MFKPADPSKVDRTFHRLYKQSMRDSSSLKTGDIEGASPHHYIYDKQILRDQYFTKHPNALKHSMSQQMDVNPANAKFDPITGSIILNKNDKFARQVPQAKEHYDIFNSIKPGPTTLLHQPQHQMQSNLLQKSGQNSLHVQQDLISPSSQSSSLRQSHLQFPKEMPKNTVQMRNPFYSDFEYGRYNNKDVDALKAPTPGHLVDSDAFYNKFENKVFSNAKLNRKEPEREFYSQQGHQDHLQDMQHDHHHHQQGHELQAERPQMRRDNLWEKKTPKQSLVSSEPVSNNSPQKSATYNEDICHFYDVDPTEKDFKRLENMNPRKIKDKLDQMRFNKDFLSSSAKYDKSIHTIANNPKGAYEKMKEFDFRENVSNFYGTEDNSSQFKEYEHFKKNYDNFYRGYTPQQDEAKALSFGKFTQLGKGTSPYARKDFITFDPVKGAPMLKYRTPLLRQPGNYQPKKNPVFVKPEVTMKFFDG